MLVRVLLLSAMVLLMMAFMVILVRMLIGPGATDRLLAGSYAAATLTAVLLIEVVLSGRVQIVPVVFLFAVLSFACGLSAAELGSRTPSTSRSPHAKRPVSDTGLMCPLHQARRGLEPCTC